VKKIIDFWKHSYETDRISFWLEMISFVFTVGASLTLAVNADSPDMRYVYPGFFIGATTAVIAYYRRKLVWPMVLTGYFQWVNVFGFGRAVGWW
jgi:hypothetical protein